MEDNYSLQQLAFVASIHLLRQGIDNAHVGFYKGAPIDSKYIIKGLEAEESIQMKDMINSMSNTGKQTQPHAVLSSSSAGYLMPLLRLAGLLLRHHCHVTLITCHPIFSKNSCISSLLNHIPNIFHTPIPMTVFYSSGTMLVTQLFIVFPCFSPHWLHPPLLLFFMSLQFPQSFQLLKA